jgi:hypothetical protein
VIDPAAVPITLHVRPIAQRTACVNENVQLPLLIGQERYKTPWKLNFSVNESNLGNLMNRKRKYFCRN